jgi:hypothetical protein
MNSSSSPAHSSISTTAIVGSIGLGIGLGSSTNTALSTEDLHFPTLPISIQLQQAKQHALLALKSDLMAALDKEVKSMDEDNWKFEGPRSRIHLISRRDFQKHDPK